MKQSHKTITSQIKVDKEIFKKAEEARDVVNKNAIKFSPLFEPETTFRKTAESLQRNEEFSSSLLASIPYPIIVIENDTSIKYVNPAFEDLTGFSFAEINSHKIPYPWYSTDTFDEISEYLAKNRHEIRGKVERIYQKKSGEQFFVEEIISSLKSEDKPECYLISWVDITERQKAKDLLRESNNLYATLFEHSPFPLWEEDWSAVKTFADNIRYSGVEDLTAYFDLHPEDIIHIISLIKPVKSNQAALKTSLTGEIRELSIKDPSKYFSRETLAVFKESISGIIEGKTAVDYEIDHPNIQGDKVQRIGKMCVAPGCENTLHRVFISAIDITERQREEKARIERAETAARTEQLQLSRQRMVANQESLRREIAQELHGSVQNRLIILLHRMAELESLTGSDELISRLKDISQSVTELLDDHIRPISYRLYPSILRQGIVPSLQSLTDRFESILPIKMELDDNLVRHEKVNRRLIPEKVKLAAYRIAEEALINVVKHANNDSLSAVTVALKLTPKGFLYLMINDNGQGFDIDKTRTGLGTHTMHDYAEVVGGECAIRSVPGYGTEVVAIFPFEALDTEHPQIF